MFRVEDVIHFHYSNAGELARVFHENGADFCYAYDKEGLLTSIRTGDGKKMSYTYDADFMETRTMTLEGRKIRTAYDGLGRVETKTFIDGMDERYATVFSYRATGRTKDEGSCSTSVESITYRKVPETESATVDNDLMFTYAYNDDGNIREICQVEKDAETVRKSYVYDDLGQLIRVNDGEEGKTKVYVYDAGSNMTCEKVYAYTTAETPEGDFEERIFTYDSTWKDQLKTIKVNDDEEGMTLSYDGAGNLKSFNGMSFTWKSGRQLSGITKSDGTQLAFTYDHSGMRVSKTVGSVRHSYSYCGSLLMEEKKDSLNMRFSYDTAGNPVGILYNGTEYYYMRNLQGDIIGLINKNGEWVVRYRYDVWGNVLEVSGVRATTLGQDNPFRYRGYYYDAEIGFYYVSSRYYDPEVGRFISPDNVLAGIGQSVQGYNLYSYCFNNPVNMDDPDGNWPKWATKVAVGVGVALCVAAVAVLTCGVGTATLAGAVAVGAAKGTLIGAAAGTVVGAGIGYSNTKTIEGAKTGAKLGFGVGASIGAVVGAGVSGAQYGTFSSKASLTQHFEKHGNEFSNLYSSAKEYAEGAKYVINNGTYLPEKNAYIRFFGSKGKANYAFVGMKSGGRVSTFHVKSVNAMVKDGITLFMK